MARKVVTVVNVQMCATCSHPKNVWCTKFWATSLHGRATANFLFRNCHLVTIATGAVWRKFHLHR